MSEWKMVPVEPTSAMIDAGWSAQSNSVHPMLHSYRAMLAAAPKPGDSNE